MDNIGAVLKRQGLGWGDVVKCTVMLDNMADWPAFNKVYVTYFPTKNSRPEARSAPTASRSARCSKWSASPTRGSVSAVGCRPVTASRYRAPP